MRRPFRETAMKFIAWHPILTLGIVAVLSGSLVLGFNLLKTEDGSYETAAADEPLIVSKLDERLLELDKEAVDYAYRDKVQHLISVWFLDETGQPGRFVTGVRSARKRYIDMMNAIEKRENELKTLRGLRSGTDNK